MLLIIWRIHV